MKAVELTYNPVPMPHTCPYCGHITNSLNWTYVRCRKCHLIYEVYRGQADHILQHLHEKGPLTVNELVELIDGTDLPSKERCNAAERVRRLLRKSDRWGLVEEVRGSPGGKWRVKE